MILERALITVKPGQAEAFKAAFAKARSGAGPSLIECLTYRHSGHSRGAERPAALLRAVPEPRHHQPGGERGEFAL